MNDNTQLNYSSYLKLLINILKEFLCNYNLVEKIQKMMC